MKQVTKAEFYARMNPLDVHPIIVSDYPYTSEWRLHRDRRQMIGKTVDSENKGCISTAYFLVAA